MSLDDFANCPFSRGVAYLLVALCCTAQVQGGSSLWFRSRLSLEYRGLPCSLTAMVPPYIPHGVEFQHSFSSGTAYPSHESIHTVGLGWLPSSTREKKKEALPVAASQLFGKTTNTQTHQYTNTQTHRQPHTHRFASLRWFLMKYRQRSGPDECNMMYR